ncbi:hypothetical protein U1Q18_048529 [Sarracenia purpurea var. burkii]
MVPTKRPSAVQVPTMRLALSALRALASALQALALSRGVVARRSGVHSSSALFEHLLAPFKRWLCREVWLLGAQVSIRLQRRPIIGDLPIF